MEIQLIQRWLSTVGEYVELRCKAMATFSAKSSASGSSSWPKIIIWVIDLYIKCHGLYNWVNMNSQCTLQKRLKFHGCSSCFIVCHPFLAAPCRQTRSLATCSHDQKISHWLQTLRREVKMWSAWKCHAQVPRPRDLPCLTWDVDVPPDLLEDFLLRPCCADQGDVAVQQTKDLLPRHMQHIASDRRARRKNKEQTE